MAAIKTGNMLNNNQIKFELGRHLVEIKFIERRFKAEIDYEL